jgi:CheY-like chemotaxis protein
MSSKERFAQDVQDAYRHLYDIVHLRSHTLSDALLPTADVDSKEKAWRLHEKLLAVIDELDPGPQSPVFSPEWRRHRLMVLRYVNGLNPQECADQLSISRRQFYREHDSALAAVVDLLWDRRVPVKTNLTPSREQSELLRQEALRITRTEQDVHLAPVIEAVITLLKQVARQKEIGFVFASTPLLPATAVDASILRQMLIGILGSMIEDLSHVDLHIAVRIETISIDLSILVESRNGSPVALGEQWHERLATVRDLAEMNGVNLLPLAQAARIVGVELSLPRGRQTAILVVDDNADMRLLFQRYLAPHAFQVLTAAGVSEAVETVKQTRPDLIILDLMMPEQDGWDLLQHLRSQPGLDSTPVIVCSVLQQRDLVLALGANAFLPKPIEQETLVATVKRLIED